MNRDRLSPPVRQSQSRKSALFAAVISASFAVPFASVAQQAAVVQGPRTVEVSSPESVGLSSARLELIAKAFTKEIEDKQLPGVAIMVARKGKVVYSNAFGVRDPNGSDPMRTDTIVRIYSMTKPMVSVAAMLLVEDGVLQLIDPVSKWLPAFKDVKVTVAGAQVNADRPMTVQDLLRHTSGLAYGELTASAPVKEALTKAGLYKPGVIDFDVRDLTPAEQVERLSKVPLQHQPGTTWEYSLSSDLLGRVVEAASGKRLGDFLQERVFKPLKMNDTAFHVPEAKANRLAGAFEKDPVNGAPFRLIDVSKQPANDSGGAGAVSTAADYLRFAQMLLNGGTLDGERIMSRTTIRYMSSDHLGTRIQPAATPGGGVLGATGYTFGLGFAVRPSDGMVGAPGTAGDFYWGGYAGTYFWVDPKEQITAVMMYQSPGARRPYHRNLVRQLVYQAVSDQQPSTN
jgi:CubicO group peptidase (beta-lactamase class C family)